MSKALRTLRLLEEHHRKLATAIRTKDRILAEAADQHEHERDDTSNHGSPPPPIMPPRDSSPSAQTPLSASPQTRFRQRTGSPALAKDIASRRGIPSVQDRRVSGTMPGLTSVNPAGTMISGRFPVQPAQNSQHVPSEDAKSSNDESFAKFYSAITAGPLSRLSSMLAFTGLPLTDSDSGPKSPTRLEQSRARVTDKPEVEKYISKAALRAIEAQHQRQGFSGSTFGGGESFYVIPTSGGTASYANIVSRTRDEAPKEESDVFVDARGSFEQPQPKSNKTVREEELTLENESLKQILDKLSHRLQAFESHAQDASMAALAQSVTWNRPSGPDADDRMRAMEAQLQREMKEREALALENQKQKGIILKYRSHWDQLKTSARAKEQAKRDAAQS